MQKSAKIYIAGHNGLVGSAIWKNLENGGFHNLIGKRSSELDLRNQQAVFDFFEKEKPEYVFLAAAKVGGILANNTYRADFIYENLAIQNNIIHAAYLNNVKKLLFLGSTCIYPKEAPQPMPENCLLTDVLEYTNEPYALAKIAGIKMCESYNIQYGTDFISVMPTNLYGPNDNFDLEKSHVLPAMIRKIHLAKALENGDWESIRTDLKKLPIGDTDEKSPEREILKKFENFGIKKENGNVILSLWGTGTPMREFLWSEDMADACVFVMQNVSFKDVAKECATEIRNTHINIGTGKEITIADLAVKIKQTVGFQGQIQFDTTKPDGTMRKLTDPSKLHSLGWKHSIDLDKGIGKMYDYYVGSL